MQIIRVIHNLHDEIIEDFTSFRNNFNIATLIACRQRWEELDDALKKREPPSLMNVHATIYKSKLYV